MALAARKKDSRDMPAPARKARARGAGSLPAAQAPAVARGALRGSTGASEAPAARWAECRALGHSWQHTGSAPVGSGERAFRSQCSLCLTIRTKYLTRYGALGGLRYEWPDDYRDTGEEKLSTLDWRRTFVFQVFGEDD